ncbi:MAG: 4-hydroxy-tetrahydrodipicolinate reductase [Pseudomonadota bacterium]
MALALWGSSGRMGQAINALEECIPLNDLDNPPPSQVEAVIDFSSPAGAAAAANFCKQHKLPLVTGTTGLDDAEQKAINDASSAIAIVQSGNMSLGITLLRQLVAKVAGTLSGFDIEILETHHRHKKDSPSGTALLLGEAAARGRGSTLSERARFTRHGRDEVRNPEDIGFAVRRGGGVYGEHEVSFMGDGETLSLAHTALSRDAFAKGALEAGRWVIGKPAGLYNMGDVLSVEA